jgi:hypothetical protein
MARFFLIALLGFGLAACSQNEHGKKVITEQCIAGGEAVEVCECLAKEADAKLDQDLFDIVVLGARGASEETEARMVELDPQARAKFAAAVPQIIRSCGGQGYLAGS